MTSPPLEGTRVVEVGQFMAAPFAGMQLADLGADVVKVEHPDGGDPMRRSGPFQAGESSPFVRLNRNKRSVAIDLKDPRGRDVFGRLVRDSDVLLENLRPGAMHRLGLDYDALRADNPRLVYVSASGWGQDGPDAALPGLDIMAQARSGLMSITGMPGGDPVKVGVPVCDLVCGLYAAMGAMAALTARERTGAGQHVDVSLFEAGVSLAIWEAGRYWATGEVGAPLGSAHQNTAPYQAVRTADGWATVGAVTPKTWTAFCAALDLDDLGADPDLADAYARHARRAELIPLVEERSTGYTTAEMVELLQDAGVPCAPIADYAAVFTDPHLRAREYFWDADHPLLGPVRQLGSPMRLSGTPGRRGTAGPPLGADTAPVLAGLGLSAADLAELADAGVICGAGDGERP